MRKFQINIFCSILTISHCVAALGRPRDFRNFLRPGSDLLPRGSRIIAIGEPTCEELKGMWRFSRRQSRAAEITNEIPTYRDPLAHNVWEHYPKVRSAFGTYRSSLGPPSKPIYGRTIKYAPVDHPRVLADNNRIYKEIMKYMNGAKSEKEPISRPETPPYRLSEAQRQPSLSSRGSFQKLKELIWAERAKDLQEQRLLEGGPDKSELEKSAQQNNDDFKSRNSNYNNIDQKAKASRLRLINDEADLNAAYAPDMFIQPYGERLAFDSESSNERLW